MPTIEMVRKRIEHNGDGPLSPFVLMTRACELASKPGSDHETVANALYLALKERGWCTPVEGDGEYAYKK